LSALIPLPATGLESLTPAEIDRTMSYAEAEKSAATRRAYASDWHDFEAWCSARGAAPLPAHQGLVGAYLAHLAGTGRKASTISRRAAAIAYRHKLAAHEPPTNAEGVRAIMRGIRRTIGTAPDQKAAATAAIVRRMVEACPDDTLAGLRDRALILVGFAGALRRSELVAIDVDHLTWTDDGARLLIPRSKTDQEAHGQAIALLRGTRLRPVAAVRTWLDAASITSGAVFLPVALGDRLGDTRLTADSAARIVKRAAKAAGLDAEQFSGHSLRAGYVTSAVEADAPLLKVTEVTRHKSLDMLRVYSRRVDLFRDHSGAAFL
jgi:integrase